MQCQLNAAEQEVEQGPDRKSDFGISPTGCSTRRRHYLLSLEERVGAHISALDSDYDDTKCDDCLTTA
jgi:hypothetical protein